MLRRWPDGTCSSIDTPELMMGSVDERATPSSTKKWILNAFSLSGLGHVAAGLWKHPDNRAQDFTDIHYWIELAKILDGNFHCLFLADMLGIYDVYKGPGNIDPVLPGAAQFPLSDPSLPIAAMAAVTKSLSFGITASTTYEHPYLLARRYSTLDHLTDGRVAWNIVTSYLESAARNSGLDTQVQHDERYEIAQEHVEVVYKLLEGSWRDDAVVRNLKTKEFTAPGRVRRIDHEGKYFKVAGPHGIAPSRQRTPFIFQAGASKAGKPFAVRNAEAMFIPGMDVETVRKTGEDIRNMAREQGRDPANIKLIVGMLVIVDETDELAQAKYNDYLSYADLEGSLALFAGWTGADLGPYDDDDEFEYSGPGAIQSVVSAWKKVMPGSQDIRWTKKRVATELALGGPHPKAIGSATTVADILQSWVDEAGVDGFNISYAICPGDFEAVVKYLIPELKRRDVFWDAQAAEGKTMRENYLADGKGPRLRSDHFGARFKWPAPETKAYPEKTNPEGTRTAHEEWSTQSRERDCL
ncbi:Monooxygenase [Teratosphaeria destructans]|uniref:Monooxygenase n=1 Tax=Teratosphaeria destructans TaxID=418781 RepID=A0A9W7SRP7_9PEZI|nr:Monooxygenase [Teratosphaeria destructans]